MLTVKVDALAADGEFVGRCIDGEEKGKKAFVKFAAPGELVSIYPQEKKHGFVRGLFHEVVESSPLRIDPPCPFFGGCGGCDLQHLPIDVQRSLKRDLVASLFERQFSVVPTEGVTLWQGALPAFAYRNRIRLQVSRDGVIGFFGSGSHTVIPISTCHIVEPALRAAVEALAPLRFDSARQLELRLRPGGAVELRVIGKLSRVRIPTFIKVVESGREDGSDEFSQVNQRANEALQSLVGEAISEEEVLDLYAGSGNFSFQLAHKGHSITAVELSDTLVQLGKNRAAKERARVTFHQARCEVFLRRNEVSAKALVLDPPRAGAKEVVEQLPRSVEQIAYVSCMPSTAGRDLSILVKQGFEVKKTVVVDMFPQTGHVETVSVLARR